MTSVADNNTDTCTFRVNKTVEEEDFNLRKLCEGNFTALVDIKVVALSKRKKIKDGIHGLRVYSIFL